MIITGISDEAGKNIETQIKAHRELGWNELELRAVNGINAAGDLPDDEFDVVAGKIEDSGLKVTCFASALANWSRNIADDFSLDVNELKTAIPRMKRMGVKFIRSMSWVGDGAEESQWKAETLRRYKELAKMAEDGGVYLAHENCTGWAGLSAENMRELIEATGSDNVITLFDTGNTISHGYDTWKFYTGVKDLIRYVHIKDCKLNPDGGVSSNFTFPGQGDAMIGKVLADILADGYDGVISIEPHVSAIAHDGGVKPTDEDMYNSYLKYGRMLEDIIAGIKTP